MSVQNHASFVEKKEIIAYGLTNVSLFCNFIHIQKKS